MTDIRKLAAEAGVGWWAGQPGYQTDENGLARFAALVRQEALEEAARVCDMIEHGHTPAGHRATGVAWECADEIRALARAKD